MKQSGIEPVLNSTQQFCVKDVGLNSTQRKLFEERNSKFRSKVSMRHLFLVKVSNVIGVVKFVAFFVMST